MTSLDKWFEEVAKKYMESCTPAELDDFEEKYLGNYADLEFWCMERIECNSSQKGLHQAIMDSVQWEDVLYWLWQHLKNIRIEKEGDDSDTEQH